MHPNNNWPKFYNKKSRVFKVDKILQSELLSSSRSDISDLKAGEKSRADNLSDGLLLRWFYIGRHFLPSLLGWGPISSLWTSTLNVSICLIILNRIATISPTVRITNFCQQHLPLTKKIYAFLKVAIKCRDLSWPFLVDSHHSQQFCLLLMNDVLHSY